jgi:hypothetical protein
MDTKLISRCGILRAQDEATGNTVITVTGLCLATGPSIQPTKGLEASAWPLPGTRTYLSMQVPGTYGLNLEHLLWGTLGGGHLPFSGLRGYPTTVGTEY